MGSSESKETVQIDKDAFLVNCDVMQRVGFSLLDNFFNELVPMLRNLKKAHYEIKAKSNQFIRITEVDLLKNCTINDAVLNMIYCLVASNGKKTGRCPYSRNCTCCQTITVHRKLRILALRCTIKSKCPHL
jgi:hypothetical protein